MADQAAEPLTFGSFACLKIFEDQVVAQLPPAALGRLAATSRVLRSLVASLPRSCWVGALAAQGVPAQHPLYNAPSIPQSLAIQARVQLNFCLDASHTVHQPMRLQLAPGELLSHSTPLQVAAVHSDAVLARHVLSRTWHQRVELPDLPRGLHFACQAFSPDDACLLLLLPAAPVALPSLTTTAVPVCVADLQAGTLTSWQVSQPQALLHLPFLGWSPKGDMFLVSHLLLPEALHKPKGHAQLGASLSVYTAAGSLLGSRQAQSFASLVWSPCGHMIAATEHPGEPMLCIWHPASGDYYSSPIAGGHAEDNLCWSPCSRHLLLSNPGSKVLRIFRVAPAATELSQHTLFSEVSRVSWGLQGITVLHQGWPAGPPWGVTQSMLTASLGDAAADLRLSHSCIMEAEALCYLVGPVSSPDGLLVAFSMRQSSPQGRLASCTLVVTQLPSMRQKTHDVAFEVDRIRWSADGTQLTASGGALQHLVLNYAG